jgi:hypothetical protein
MDTRALKFADIKHSSDILSASKVPTCPQFPFVPLGEENIQTLQDQLDTFRRNNMESEFLPPILCRMGLITEQMAQVFQAVKSYTSAIDGYQDRSLTEPGICQISNMRNFVQCQLLSLPSVLKLGPGVPLSRPIYESCRLAGMIFGIGVIFPLPSQTAPFAALANFLQAELCGIDIVEFLNEEDSVVTGVLIWILTLGGIAAAPGSEEKAWYTRALSHVIIVSNLSTWPDVKPVLQKMLWLDSACDFAGQQLWGEVQVQSSIQ